MATKQELEKKLADLKDSLDAVPSEFKADIQKEIDATEAEIKALGSSAPAKKKTAAPVGDDAFLKAFTDTIMTIMAAGSGTGVDSKSVRDAIQTYLRDDKVKLSELDQSVLEEIKRNQTVILEIPDFSKKIEISAAVARIPNFYEIIDDLLAGNNVYLIGEAGGGKTYTAEQVAQTLGIMHVTLNCSQYTSPLEILGGQSIEGFKEGKLIDCWRNGKILIMDEMPKLDPNTAGLFNDALAKSSKTKIGVKINSANAQEPPIPRAENFGIIATGNIYPNQPPTAQYRGNNQQDLSLLDRFSGSVYYTEFDKNTDQDTTRFKFLYEFLVGNYYEYIKARNNGESLPPPRGLRTVIESIEGFKSMALVSYRTNISFRVGFEYELIREVAKRQGKPVQMTGKTLLKTFQSYLVAFGRDAKNTLIQNTKYTDSYIEVMVKDAINQILKDEKGFLGSLNPLVEETAKIAFPKFEDLYSKEIKRVK